MKYMKCILLSVLFACSPEPPADKSVTLSDLMKTHFATAEDMRDAIVNGDVVTLHSRAKSLSEPVAVSDLPQKWGDHLDAMRVRASRITGQYDTQKAAIEFASLAGSCAACHQMAGVAPAVRTYAAPPPDVDLQTHMLRHAWAAARMWEGLIVPSDEKWRAGAAILASEPLSPETYPDQPKPAGFVKIGTEIHELGVRAVNATMQPERIDIYASFIGRCAACHSASRSEVSQ
jgi:cytochrome c553